MSQPERPDNLTRGTLRGLSWVYTSTAVGALMQLVYTAVMGRLLEPADFGLIAMALVVLRFGTYFARMGVGQALIQKAELDDEDIRVGFTTSVLLGLAFGLAIVMAAPLAGVFFETDAVVPVVRVLALSFVLDSLARVSMSLLRRALRFRALALIEFVSYPVAFLGVGIGMAAMGFGVWSLVGAQLTQVALKAMLAFAAARHPLTPSLRWDRMRVLYGYGSRVSVISFLEFIGSSLDTLIIGRLAGQHRLGHYNRAYLLVNLPFEQIVTGLSRVLFPAFSRIHEDRARLLGAYRSAVGAIAAVLLPTAAGLAVAAPEVVRVLLGPQWDLAARILPALAFAAATNFLSHVGGVVCDATATLNRKLALQTTYVLALSALLLVAAREDDLLAYAAAVLAASVLRQVLYMRLMGRVLGFGARAHVALYGGALVTAGLVSAAVGAVSLGARPFLSAGGVFALQVTTGALVLGLALLWGPLASVRHDVRARMDNAGVLRGDRRLGRVLRRGLEVGRRP